VRLTHRKKIGPGDAAMAKPRANPLSSRLNTASPHGDANSIWVEVDRTVRGLHPGEFGLSGS